MNQLLKYLTLITLCLFLNNIGYTSTKDINPLKNRQALNNDFIFDYIEDSIDKELNAEFKVQDNEEIYFEEVSTWSEKVEKK
jgi:hypothetical protein